VKKNETTRKNINGRSLVVVGGGRGERKNINYGSV
jgi:hypothetical protein